MPLIRSLQGTKAFGRRGSRWAESLPRSTSVPKPRELDCGCKPVFYVRPAIGDIVLCRVHTGGRVVIR
jgi:hypothetical protein